MHPKEEGKTNETVQVNPRKDADKIRDAVKGLEPGKEGVKEETPAVEEGKQEPEEKKPLTQQDYDRLYTEVRNKDDQISRLNEKVNLLQETFTGVKEKPEVKVDEREIPREKRTKMDDDTWNEWYQENPREAITWLNKRDAEKTAQTQIKFVNKSSIIKSCQT